MGLELTAQAEEMEDGLRINLEGEQGVMLTRRQGEVLASLQHVVSSVYRQETLDGRRLVVDCNGFRKGKDAELKQMAIFLGEKAKSTGFAQEMGPLTTNAASSTWRLATFRACPPKASATRSKRPSSFRPSSRSAARTARVFHVRYHRRGGDPGGARRCGPGADQWAAGILGRGCAHGSTTGLHREAGDSVSPGPR